MPMRVLVTGAAGFVGRYAIRELQAAGHSPVGFDRTPAADLPCPLVTGDIRDAPLLRDTVRRIQPDAGLHLAAIAFPPGAAEDPLLMAAVNVLGTVAICDAFRREAPRARLLVVSSARVYGSPSSPIPLDEEAPLAPDSYYAATKAAADLLARRYARDFGCPFLVARPHNHTGPGQPEAYAIPSFIRQILALRAQGGRGSLRVGNMESRRDFLDVRDVVRAYRLLLERGTPGCAYNIASGHALTIGELIERIAHLAGVVPHLETDPSRMRPTDASAPLDLRRIRRDTGWEPRIPLDQTLQEMLTV